MVPEVIQRDWEIQLQHQKKKIGETQPNLEYYKSIPNELPRYLTNEANEKNIKLIARYRYRNEGSRRQYWRNDDDPLCRLYKNMKKRGSIFSTNAKNPKSAHFG